MSLSRSSKSKIGVRITLALTQSTTHLPADYLTTKLLWGFSLERCRQKITTLLMMNKKEFDKYLARDGGCVHCGSINDTLIPHHRANRGMGGSKAKDVPSNIVVLCAKANNDLESSSGFATLGRHFGWKLVAGQVPSQTPIFIGSQWWLLNDKFGRVRAQPLDEGLD